MRNFKLWLLLLAATAVTISGCTQPQLHEKKAAFRQSFLGRWDGENGWLELTPGGLVGRVEGGSGWAGRYETVDDIRLEVDTAGEAAIPAIWNVAVSGDELTLTLPDGKTENFKRHQQKPTIPKPELLARWDSTSVGEGRKNILEFTDTGAFVSFRWISPAGGGEKYQVGEAGTFMMSGDKLTLTGFRKREFTKELEFEVKDGTLEVRGMWKDKDGNPTKRTYHRR